MKVFLVVDTYQYDGGLTIEGIYLDSNKALIHQQKLRRERRKSWGLIDPLDTKPLESITIIEMEPTE